MVIRIVVIYINCGVAIAIVVVQVKCGIAVRIVVVQLKIWYSCQNCGSLDKNVVKNCGRMDEIVTIG